MEAPRKVPRFWIAMQPTIVRLYKVAGLVLLTAILIGLIGFLVVNVFYFFNHTWVRPVVLSPNHPKVVEAQNQLDDAKLEASKLKAEREDLENQLDQIDRTVKADEAFLAEVGTSADSPKTPEQWLLHHEVEKTKLDHDNELGRRGPIKTQLTSLDMRIKDEDELVERLGQSPYLRAVKGKVVLGFVPYQNLRSINASQHTKLYACSWGIVLCHVVGTVEATLDGEVENIHPHDESVQRGIMVEIKLTTPSAEGENVLFAGSKPLYFF